MSSLQHIIWPWDTKRWPDIKNKICVQSMSSIVEMDMRISSIAVGKIMPKQITEMFNRYYADDIYAHDRVPQDHFVGQILPWMQLMIARAPKLFMNYDGRMLFPAIETNIVLSRPQVATIIIAMWFGLFNYDYVSRAPKGVGVRYTLDDFSVPLFTPLFASQNIFGLQCMMTYFAHVYQLMNDPSTSDTFQSSMIILKRSHINPEPDWAVDVPICKIDIATGHVDNGITTPPTIYIANAHQYIGGDFFCGSLTQEEVTLLIRPECMCAVLLCARLDANETLCVLGTERLSHYSGYGSSVRFDGLYNDITPTGHNDTCSMIQSTIIFMDAGQRITPVAQFTTDFMRDLNKAYCGFNSLVFTRKRATISCSNWTYGFNGNNMQLKFIQLVLAASLAGKDLIYYPFSHEFIDCINTFTDWLEQNNITVGILWGLYIQFACGNNKQTRFNDLDLFDCIMDFY